MTPHLNVNYLSPSSLHLSFFLISFLFFEDRSNDNLQRGLSRDFKYSTKLKYLETFFRYLCKFRKWISWFFTLHAYYSIFPFQTRVTLESFIAWKKRKIEEKKEKIRKEEEKKRNEFKSGKNIGLSGREMFR